MRSQGSVLAHSTKSLGSLTLATTTNTKETNRSATPVAVHSTHTLQQSIQMTTGSSINSGNSTSATTIQSNSSSTFPLCSTIASNSSLNTLSKSSTISSTTRHSNVSLSANNNNLLTTLNNNNIGSTNNNSYNEGNNNQNRSKLQTLEQRKLELEKLLNEKNWLLQQIHKQEAQILNGNYENLDLFESGKGVVLSSPGTGGTTAVDSGINNSILRRKGSSSLKLPKNNGNFNGKNNRFTLSKSEYDLAQENKLLGNQTTPAPTTTATAITNQNVMNVKKRYGPPHKTNSFHDSTSTSALSLTKSPSFEYKGSIGQSGSGGVGSNNNHHIKYSIIRTHQDSNENLSNILGITQCDKYYLSPTNQMYTDGNGFIKGSQNIKQCLSPSSMHKIIGLNDTVVQRAKKQTLHSAIGHNLNYHNGSQSHLEPYESVDAPPSLSPLTNFEQNQHNSNLLRSLNNNDKSAWCETTSYVELDGNVVSQFHNSKPHAKTNMPHSIIAGSTLQPQPDHSPLGNFYTAGSGFGGGSFLNPIEKSCDEISLSSVNSESNKKPKIKEWMESSLDGPVIRQNILQNSSLVADTISLCPTLLTTLSQNSQFAYYNIGRQETPSSMGMSKGKIASSPSPAGAGGGKSLLVVPVVNSRPSTRTLAHNPHPHHKQSYRERTKLSSQSMSSGTYRTPKTKLDDDTNHLSHSTSYLNVDPYLHHHFQQQPQSYHHIHYHHMDTPNSNSNSSVKLAPLQQVQQLQQQQQLNFHQQKLPKLPSYSASQQQQQQPTPLPKFSPTVQQPQQSSSIINGEDFVATIRYANSVATQPSRLCNPSQAVTKNILPSPIAAPPLPPPNSISINSVQQISPTSSAMTPTPPDIRIESPKNMTVVQQATFFPYKEVTKPFEMSDFYKYSTKFRQKEANTATMSKNTT